MTRFSSLFLFVLITITLIVSSKTEVLCETDFCRTYSFEKGCSTTSHHCSINNATHAGITLLSPTICNCCDYCLPFYGQHEICSLGGAGDGITVGRCGPGLTCTLGIEEPTCQRMPASMSKCHAQQDEYDERYEKGEVGTLEQRPLCDGDGNFAPVHCVPTQSCFCQSEDGERLFGEVLYQGTTTIQNMHCGCSRLNHKIQKMINSGLKFPTDGPRCTSDGNFNPIQCIDKTCYCVNRITGAILGDSHVDMDIQPISALKDCYKPEFDLFARYESDSPPFNFTSPCLEDKKRKIELIIESESDGYIVDYFSEVENCWPDGTYGRVAIAIDGTKQCVNASGVRLGSYTAEPNTKEYDEMNCNCAVTSELMKASLERPVCCKNGNFRPVQCRRGLCHCVDQDGRQTVKETSHVSALPCVTEHADTWQSC